MIVNNRIVAERYVSTTMMSISFILMVVIWTTVLAIDEQNVAIVLFHNRGMQCNESTASLQALQREMTARWAAEIINNQTSPQLFPIEIQIIDTCGRNDVAQQRANQIARQTRQRYILGVIALDEPDVLNNAANIFRINYIPLVVATPKASEILLDTNGTMPSLTDNVFSAVPNSASIARATMAVAKGIQSNSIRILGSCSHMVRSALQAAKQLQLNVLSAEHWMNNASSTTSFIESIPFKQESTETIAVLMEPRELHHFMTEILRKWASLPVTWLLGCLGSIGPQIASQWALVLGNSAFLIEPHMPELAGLSQYLEQNGVLHQPFDNEIPHIVEAVSALGAAFHLQELNNCHADGDSNITCRPDTIPDPQKLPEEMIAALRKLSLPKTKSSTNVLQPSPRELEGSSNHFTPSGRLVANRYLVQKLVAGTGETSPVAWYSDDDGLILAAVMSSHSNGRFYFFGHASSGPILGSVPPISSLEDIIEEVIPESKDAPGIPPAANNTELEDSAINDVIRQEQEILITSKQHTIQPVFVFGRTWAAAVIAVAATQVLAALYILIFISVRICEGAVHGPHSLGILLLLALIGLLSSVTIYVLPIRPCVCYVKLFLPPLLLVTCYSIILAKLLQLKGNTSTGIGGYVPQFPLYLAIFLAVAVQAAVSSHFYIQQQQQHQPQESLSWVECSLSRSDLLLLYLFLFILMLITTVYAAGLRHLRRSTKEAQLILVATSLSTTVLLSWAIACGLMPIDYRDAATASLLVILAAILLGSIFIPKMAKLSRQQREISSKASSLSTTATISTYKTLPSLQPSWLLEEKNTQNKWNDIHSSNQPLGTSIIRHPLYNEFQRY